MEKKTNFKELSREAKIQYIWDYYRWPIIITIAVCASVISLIHHYATYKPPLLDVIMFNVVEGYNATSDGFDEFMDAYGYNPDEEEISLNSSLNFPENDEMMTSYNDHQVMTVLITGGDIDLFFGNGSVYQEYAETGILMDLREILPAETLERYKDQLIYSTDNGETKPYPCAVRLQDHEWLTKNKYYSDCYFGIFYDPGNPKACREFADFLLNYPETPES